MMAVSNKKKKKNIPLPKWKCNPDFEHLPLFEIPYNYVRVTSERDCPPGIYGWITCEKNQVYLSIRQLRYESDRDTHKIKINPADATGYPVNTWNGIKSKIPL